NRLVDMKVDLPMAQFIAVNINSARAGFQPFRRVDTTGYPTPLLEGGTLPIWPCPGLFDLLAVSTREIFRLKRNR
ncbi:MAG: hypothetical protein P8X39_05825, partial [Desulfofustis sp.]